MSSVNLVQAKFNQPLCVESVLGLSEELQIFLRQIGIFPAQAVTKIHTAPLGDPVTIKIGGQRFALRKEVCNQIFVSEL